LGISGSIRAADWDEELEDSGQVLAWLNTNVEIDAIPDSEDWAVRARVWQVLHETNKTLFENVLEEVKNEFDSKRDKEDAQELAFLQSVHFEFRGRRVKTKSRRNRKSNKRTR